MQVNQPTSGVFLTLAFLFSLSSCAFSEAVPRFAFVTNANDNTVSIYTVNATSGLLRDDGYALVGSKPAGVTVTPNGKFLYVTNSASSNVSAFSVNLQNGSLTAVTGSPSRRNLGHRLSPSIHPENFCTLQTRPLETFPHTRSIAPLGRSLQSQDHHSPPGPVRQR
jgi:hypothetical protein